MAEPTSWDTTGFELGDAYRPKLLLNAGLEDIQRFVRESCDTLSETETANPHLVDKVCEAHHVLACQHVLAGSLLFRKGFIRQSLSVARQAFEELLAVPCKYEMWRKHGDDFNCTKGRVPATVRKVVEELLGDDGSLSRSYDLFSKIYHPRPSHIKQLITEDETIQMVSTSASQYKEAMLAWMYVLAIANNIVFPRCLMYHRAGGVMPPPIIDPDGLNDYMELLVEGAS